ncbi:hypothetical protein D9Q98_005841 [Chlorella vulgaris]|uniref:Uncharacterized protein n=1 Tax=Chlorella vulgaris TaxID=3077 RepID=A0A9D4Z0B0_CHLVU|nr:hypothetical protein D9Q98_005841 [Chlorella vulgaris]
MGLFGAAGVAYDGSIWVTAASSVALVVGTGGFVAAGAALLARRVSQGDLQLPGDVGPGAGGRQQARRVQPLEKSSSSSQNAVQPPPRAESVDEME